MRQLCLLNPFKGRNTKGFYLLFHASLSVLPVKNNSGVTPAGKCGTWVKEPDGGYFTSPNYPNKYPPERECVYIIEGELLLLFSHLLCYYLTLSQRFLFLSSSRSPAVHRLILWGQVLNRALLGLQVWPHRGTRWTLWVLDPDWSLLWAGKPSICALQWEVLVHQVCGWRGTGGHWILCPV